MGYSAKLNECTSFRGVGSIISRPMQLFSQRRFWVGFWGKWAFFVVFGWTKRGALLGKTWWIDGRFVARENMPAF
jgi:hypothetical protein